MMTSKKLIIGETASWEGEFRDKNGDPLSFDANQYALYRILMPDDTVVDLDTREAAEWAWTDQGNAQGIWTITSTEAENLQEGRNIRADCWYYDPDQTPELKLEVGTAVLNIEPSLVAAP